LRSSHRIFMRAKHFLCPQPEFKVGDSHPFCPPHTSGVLISQTRLLKINIAIHPFLTVCIPD
jgi:hypothetical protein